MLRLQGIFSHRQDGRQGGGDSRTLLNSRVCKANHSGSHQGDSCVKLINLTGPDGLPLTCHGCGSYHYLIAACPYSYENAQRGRQGQSSIPQGKLSYLLATTKLQWKFLVKKQPTVLCLILPVHQQCVVKDGFSDLSIFPDNKLKTIKKSEGQKVFKFGSGEMLKSMMSCQQHCTIVGKDVIVEVDFVDSAIPLLLSLQSLKKANAKFNLERDRAEFFGPEVPLNFTLSGHYCIPVIKTEDVQVKVCNVVLSELQPPERKKALLKLHKQCAHPSMPRLKALLEDVWNDHYQEDLSHIYDGCQTCRMYAKTTAKPVVSMLMAHGFNEKVVMDHEIWEGQAYFI